MRPTTGLLVLLCVILDDHSVLSATTFRRRPGLRDEIFALTPTPTTPPAPTSAAENFESSPARRRASRLSLPSNATSIRSDISENFSCEGKAYGYYADVENDCQIFHVCLPVTYPDGKGQQFRWSFICPEETQFNQEAFTCVRTDDMPFSCADSEQFYELNRYLGLRDEFSEELDTNTLDTADERETQIRLSDRRQSVRVSSTAAPSTTTTTTTTARPTTTPRREPPRLPIYRRTSTKIVRRTTLPPTTVAPETVVTTEDTVPVTGAFDFAGLTEPSTNTIEPISYTNVYDNSFETTEYPNTATSAGTTIASFLSNAGEPITRIVPDLVEIGENSDKPVDGTEAKITDDVILNIKQLQNILPGAARIAENSTQLANASGAAVDQRGKRFLFTADAIENRRRLFNRLNSNAN